MYISFSGAQGSGKSTLANILYEQLIDKYKVARLNSITRQLLIDLDIDLYKLRKNTEGLKVWQYFALKEHFEQLNELVNKYDIVIMDRCYIDFLIYTEMFISSKYAKKLSTIFKKEIDNYESSAIKFYLEPLNNANNINDGIRDISCYDDEIKLFKMRKNMFDFIVPNMNIIERINIITEYLNNEVKI